MGEREEEGVSGAKGGWAWDALLVENGKEDGESSALREEEMGKHISDCLYVKHKAGVWLGRGGHE